MKNDGAGSPKLEFVAVWDVDNEVLLVFEGAPNTPGDELDVGLLVCGLPPGASVEDENVTAECGEKAPLFGTPNTAGFGTASDSVAPEGAPNAVEDGPLPLGTIEGAAKPGTDGVPPMLECD